MTQSKTEDCIESTAVTAPTTKEFYIAMLRYGDAYWSPCGVIFDTSDEAVKSVIYEGITAWRIIKTNLPINVPDKEV